MPITLPIDADEGPLLVARVLSGTALAREVLAQLDTGATNTAIDEKLAHDLDLPHVMDGTIHGAAFSGRPTSAYRAAVELPMGNGKWMPFDILVVSFDLSDQKPKLIVGRDILDQCTLMYEGRRGRFTLMLPVS